MTNRVLHIQQISIFFKNSSPLKLKQNSIFIHVLKFLVKLQGSPCVSISLKLKSAICYFKFCMLEMNVSYSFWSNVGRVNTCLVKSSAVKIFSAATGPLVTV